MKAGRWLMAAVLAAGLLGVGESAKASSITFLQFFQASASSKPFSLTYGSSGSIDNVPAAGIPVFVNVDPLVGGSGVIAATITKIHLSFAAGATFTATEFSQKLGAGFIDIKVGSTSVLHVDLTGGVLSSVTGTSDAVTVSSSVPADGITYSSTMFPLINGWNNQQNFSLSFSALTSRPTGASGGFLTGSSGIMSGSGTFAGSPVVPEPGTLTLALCAVPVLGLVGIRRRLRKA
jgi:hypothetical protein